MAYTEVDATGPRRTRTVTLPALSSGTTGYYNGVVVADSPAAFAAGRSPLSSPTRRPSASTRSTATPPPTSARRSCQRERLPRRRHGQLTAAGLAAMPGWRSHPLRNRYRRRSGHLRLLRHGMCAAAAPFTAWIDCPDLLGSGELPNR